MKSNKRTNIGGKIWLGLAIVALLLCVELPAGAQTWTLLHSFTGPDGSVPQAGVTMDAAGNLYGTTSAGGAHNQGTVFKLTRRGSSWDPDDAVQLQRT